MSQRRPPKPPTQAYPARPSILRSTRDIERDVATLLAPRVVTPHRSDSGLAPGWHPLTSEIKPLPGHPGSPDAGLEPAYKMKAPAAPKPRAPRKRSRKRPRTTTSGHASKGPQHVGVSGKGRPQDVVGSDSDGYASGGGRKGLREGEAETPPSTGDLRALLRSKMHGPQGLRVLDALLSSQDENTLRWAVDQVIGKSPQEIKVNLGINPELAVVAASMSPELQRALALISALASGGVEDIEALPGETPHVPALPR